MSFLAAGMASGLNKGLGEGLGNLVQLKLDTERRKADSTAKIWQAMASDPNYHPAIKQQFLQNAQIASSYDPMNPESKKQFDTLLKQSPHDAAMKAYEAMQMTGSAPDPNAQFYDSGGYMGPQQHMQLQQQEELNKARTGFQAQREHIQSLLGGTGTALRPVDQWHMLRGATGDKESDQYKTGTWTDANGVHNHEQVTMSGGRSFDRSGNEIPSNIPISFAAPHYVYDQNGNLVDAGTVDISKTPISKSPLTRTSNRTVDPWTGGSSITSTTTYGKGGGEVGRKSATAPSTSRSFRKVTTAPVASSQLDTAIPPGTEVTTPDSNIPPEIKGDKRFNDAVDALINRHASLSDFPKLVRPHLAAAMPEGIRAAENPADLANLVSADKAMSLIQSRIIEVREAAKPVNGKSVLDSLTNRAAIAAILNPPPSAEGPGLYGQGSAILSNIGQSLVRSNIDPKVVNYVTKLRQLRDDILALRKFLGNAPMRSNSQMAIQLAQVPDATTASYKDLDEILKAFETTPTAAQGMQGGGKPSAPGTATSIAPPTAGSATRKTYNGGRYYSDDGGVTKYETSTGKKIQ